jgi:2-polyprenyl-6-methoxyphenol hydroxylase-like FAD-dependent oxidoreductase
MADIAVCGGSVVGLATAMLLARDGHRVTVLESDPAARPDRPADAWAAWDRRGVAQFRQPHNLFARARQIMDAELPGLTDALLAAGCVWVDPIAALPPFAADRAARPHDDRFRFVTGRRPVLEAVFAHAAEAQPGVFVRRGVGVIGLGTNAPGTPGAPHVDRVLLAGGEQLRADLVIDAMGRRSPLASWLGALGARPPQVSSEASGFVYYTRYFRGAAPPAVVGPMLTALGSVSILTLWGDNDTWSVTVFASASDTQLRALQDPARFADVVAACPLQAHWLAGEPITEVITMAGILDRYRRMVVDDRPVATGVVTVGDAWACTNPSAGRGLSVGLLHAQRLRDVARAGLDDPDAFVRRFDAVTEAEVAPFVRNQISADRARVAEMEAIRAGGESPAPEPGAAAIGAAMLRDPDVFRAVMETVTCLALPQEVFARPDIAAKVEPFRGELPMPMPGPNRAELLALLR